MNVPTKIRYPFKKKRQVGFVEVPFDATNRDAGTFEIKVGDLPREKVQSLQYLLQQASTTYLKLIAEREAARTAASGRIESSSDSDVTEALGVVQRLDVRPGIKRLLHSQLEALARRFDGGPKDEPEARTQEANFLGQLREFAGLGGHLGELVLRFAEALFESDGELAAQLVDEAFEPKVAEAVRSLRLARKRIIEVGVLDHKDLLGELTGDDGAPLLNGQGQPQVEPIPFEPGEWSWGAKKRKGCGVETVEFYSEAEPNGGCLVSLSDAVLAWQNGVTPTPDLIWNKYLDKPAPAPTQTEQLPPNTAHPDDLDDGDVASNGHTGDIEEDAPRPLPLGAVAPS